MSTPKRVAVLDDYQRVALASANWSSLGDEVQVETFAEHIRSEDELATALQDYEVIVAMRERTAFPRSLLARLSNLKLLVTTGMANAAIDVAAARELGISVCGTKGWLPPTTEHTWALILACAKRIVECDRDLQHGHWQRHMGADLAGARLGIIGLGNYGAQVATVGKAFAMDVVAWSQNLTAARCQEVGVTPVSKAELLSTSDFVTIHLKLSDRSRHTIDEADLRTMRPTAYLINTSRGPVVNEQALVLALREQWIAGAGLDVFDVEPLPVDHPFRQMPNTVVSPHMGYVTPRSYKVFFDDVVEDIRAYLHGTERRALTGDVPLSARR